jgi:hypothetical protein
VAESVVKSFMAAYDARDPKAISALFLPDAMLRGFPAGSDVVVANGVMAATSLARGGEVKKNRGCGAALRPDH